MVRSTQSSVCEMLTEKGYIHRYRERPGGHNWATWEQGLAPALRYLFGEEEKIP